MGVSYKHKMFIIKAPGWILGKLHETIVNTNVMYNLSFVAVTVSHNQKTLFASAHLEGMRIFLQ